VKCMFCLVTLQTGETEEDHKLRFVSESTEAAVVYNGESMCLPHFNVVRGHSKGHPDD